MHGPGRVSLSDAGHASSLDLDREGEVERVAEGIVQRTDVSVALHGAVHVTREAGQIGLLDQLIVNRQAIDAERDLIDLLAEMHTTRIELEYAAGWPQQGNAR